MTTARRERFIEVTFPLEEVSFPWMATTPVLCSGGFRSGPVVHGIGSRL